MKMRFKDCFGFMLLCLINGVILSKGATVNSFSVEDRLMKLEYNEIKLKEKVAALEEQDKKQMIQIRNLEEQIKPSKEANTFYPGQDAPRTCHELWRMGETVDGEYEVDPDGNNNGYPPIKVHCTFYQDGANTEIPFEDSNTTLEFNATSCHGPGCYNVKINYTSPISQIVALIDLSRDCQQPVEYGCENAPLEANGNPMGWWSDRHSNPQYYWTNTTENMHICSCGLDNSCVEHESFGNLCHCDANLPIKETDRGFIRNSSALPVTELSAGTFYGKASFSLGQMECFGEAPYNNGESCDAYRKAGASLSGYYLTMPSGNTTNSTNVPTNTPQVSLCDMTKSSKDPEFQTDIGTLGEFGQGAPIAFNAIRNSEYSTANTKIPFTEATVNIGDAFDTATGTFTAPSEGLYHFAFHGFSTYYTTDYDSTSWSKYNIYKNAEILATAIANNYYTKSYGNQYQAYQSFSTSFYEYLESGDAIYVKTGDYVKLYDSSSDHSTQFSGSLMQ